MTGSSIRVAGAFYKIFATNHQTAAPPPAAPKKHRRLPAPSNAPDPMFQVPRIKICPFKGLPSIARVGWTRWKGRCVRISDTDFVTPMAYAT